MNVFSLNHFIWLAVAALCCWRGSRVILAPHMRRVVFAGLIANEVSWFFIRVTVFGVAVKDNLPLHLCDVTFLTAVIYLMWPHQRLADFNYFIGVPGALLAVLFPGITETGAWLPYAIVRYMATHIGIMTIGIAGVWGQSYTPSPRKAVSAWALMLTYAALLYPVNVWLNTNYFFLRKVPGSTPAFIPQNHPVQFAVSMTFVFLAFVALLWFLTRFKKRG